MKINVSIARQTLVLQDDAGNILARYPVSTAANEAELSSVAGWNVTRSESAMRTDITIKLFLAN